MNEEDRRIRNEVLRSLYEDFQDNPWNTFNVRTVIERVVEELGVSEDEIHYIIKRSDEEGWIDFSPALGGGGTIELRALGIEKLHEETGGTFLSNGKWKHLLEFLYEYEREHPQDSRATPEELVENVEDLGNNELDYNVWYLDDKGLAEAHLHIGGERAYWGVEITRFGRKVYENNIL